MPASTKNITIEQRSTFRMRLTWKDAKGKPINLSGYTARMQVRATFDGPSLIDLSTSNSRISLSAAGVIEIVVPANDTDLLSFATGVYDLKLFAPNGDEIRLLQGTVKLSRGVTE